MNPKTLTYPKLTVARIASFRPIQETVGMPDTLSQPGFSDVQVSPILHIQQTRFARYPAADFLIACLARDHPEPPSSPEAPLKNQTHILFNSPDRRDNGRPSGTQKRPNQHALHKSEIKHKQSMVTTEKFISCNH